MKTFKLFISTAYWVSIAFIALSFIEIKSDSVKASLIRIIDGDTIIITIPDWPSVIGDNIPVRIANIDAPERNCLNQWNESRNHLIGLMAGVDKVELRNIKRGKYFRLIAEVWVGGESLGERIVNDGYAVGYGDNNECNNLNWGVRNEIKHSK